MKPICVPCERFMRPKRTGYRFIEGMPQTNEAPSGKRGAGQWVPYKLWMGDLYACPDCGAETVVGVAHEPISEHYMPDFERIVTACGGASLLFVKDC